VTFGTLRIFHEVVGQQAVNIHTLEKPIKFCARRCCWFTFDTLKIRPNKPHKRNEEKQQLEEKVDKDRSKKLHKQIGVDLITTDKNART
jgi:hypothetical protein